MNSADVIAIAHDGELVCESCLRGDAEKAVFYDKPEAQDLADADGYLSVVFVDDVAEDDICGRCFSRISVGE